MPAVSVGAPAAAATFATIPFATGETLSYNINWNNYLAAAHLQLAVADRGQFFGHDGLHLTADVRTVGVVRSLVTASDSHSDSYVDPRTLLPFRTERTNSVNGKSAKSTITFDRAKNTAAADQATIPIGIDTADALTMIYRLRAMPLRTGETMTLDGVENGHRLQVRAKVEGREDVTTPAGTYKAIRVTCVPLPNGQPNEAERFVMYFSDDRARLLVLITAEPKVGPIRVELTGITGGQRASY
jgi:hypothetical protein